MFDMMGMLGKIKDLQAKMKEAQDNLVHIQASAEAGAGMVKATVNGKKQVVKIEIDPDVIKPDDREMLQDLVVAAVNKALAEVDGKAREELKKTTQGILPNIPGMDLSSLL
ncbi:YbaB/EbfC family nucleoid-associated protein [Rhodocytophaga rosea]|uniref:Nucleoid-associated protein GXP67_07430 n=1 Tax=Rhodocytophaga rosea TaxID=2704465 RepID=A0A6C0GER5_9BACT|nr:YbaB/EbfC family nucleoid-associated protein [Rhodocytophaga rosea]QHT66499.1 YbaB/EbfC family nucleoid-associated protein [Rhodocytophaga rosea]